ncbi:MAG: YkvA family protein [Gammaproteobacteria bacterium]|nr:YkvA family protein [Gammaproteobacteria bacterium]
MGLRISFELDSEDLQHLALLMEQSLAKADSASPEAILQGAHDMLAASATKGMPEFMRKRQQQLKSLVDMVEDEAWNLPHRNRLRVISALAYFVLADDLIPDHIPGLGFLDDAIMIELVVRELKPELEAYLDFCEFRRQKTRGQDEADVSRTSWLDEKRKALMGRMHRRRKAGGLGWLKLK